MNKLLNIESWNEVTRGLYVYPAGTNVAYEMHIMYWDRETKLDSANTKLYLVGEWYDKAKKKNTMEREELFTGPLCACQMAALEDFEKNMKS